MINDNEHHQAAYDHNDRNATTPTPPSLPGQHEDVTSGSSSNAPHIKENVRATLSPLPGPRAGRLSMDDVSTRSSLDITRKSWDVRRSVDASRTSRHSSHEVRRSFSGRRDKRTRSPGDRSPLTPRAMDSESATFSLVPGTDSSAAVQSINESNASPSQILNRSDLFRTPALHSPMSASGKSDKARDSQDTTRSSGAKKAQVKPSLRPTTRPSNAPLSIGTSGADEDTDAQSTQPRLSGSTSALQDIASYPLQKATGLAGFLRNRSKRMGNLLATESMGYYEKVSGMLVGGRKHYNTAEGLEPNDQIQGFEDDEDAIKAAENFREHFAFPETEVLQSSFFASLQRVLPNYGKIYISSKYFCFRSLMPTSKTKVCHS